jgi:predicted nucleic-acid-binding Zn-ribbon protein
VISTMTGKTVARPEPAALPEEPEPGEPGVPKPGQHGGLDYTCVKCANQTYEVIDVSATSGMLSRMVNLQNRRFSAVVCQRCRYAEFYQTQSGALRNIADLIIGS